MSLESVIMLATAALLTMYLLYALLKPENF